MDDTQLFKVAVLEELQKDLRFQVRDIEWSLREVTEGCRSWQERPELLERRRETQRRMRLVAAEIKNLGG